MRVFQTVLAHLTMVLSLMFLVFLVLDQFNPMMNFVDNDISRWLLGLLCACGVCRSVLSYRDSHGKENEK